MNVVIVESPAKAKSIAKYLGSDYQVITEVMGMCGITLEEWLCGS